MFSSEQKALCKLNRSLVENIRPALDRHCPFPRDVLIIQSYGLQAVADLMNDAALNFSFRKNGVNGLLEPGQAINAGDKDILAAAAL
ncbi:hypothetical protein BH10CHL1_BH10CHL1_14880 [soil metagenome]